MKKKKNWIIMSIAFLFVVGVTLGILLTEGKETRLTAVQAKSLVAEKYAGNVIGTELVDDEYYRMKLSGAKGTYEIKLEADTGKILSMRQTQSKGQSGGKETNKAPSQNSSKISQEEAKEIALKQVDGVVDEAELKGKGSTQVYEVEIKTKDKEAKVYINVYTGRVGAIVWENDD